MRPPALDARRLVETAGCLVPGAAVVFLSFQGGGFFPAAPAVVAVVLALMLVLQTTLHPDPFGGLNAGVAIAIAALGLFAAWTLVSVNWSDAPGRALVEFSRALAYLLALVVFSSPARSRRRVAWLLRGVVLGIVIVCGIGLVTRVLPELWPIRPGFEDSRLSYPLTYWNAFGILAAFGTILAFHLSASEREPAVARVLGAAAVPMLATALFFSFSRGSFGAAVLGLVAYTVAARPRGLVAGLLATAPVTAFAIAAAYDAQIVSSEDFATVAGREEGADVARTVAVAMATAALVRVLGLRLDRVLVPLRLPPRARRPVLGGTIAALAVAAVVVPLALGAPAYAERQWDRFRQPLPPELQNRERFFVPSHNDRLRLWRVALDAYEAEPLHGVGAGLYVHEWAQFRPEGALTVLDAHSLYVEVLGELGIVGLVLIAVLVATLLAGALWRARGPDRALHAAVGAALLAWAAHAGLDWDWEMPAVTLWVFALGGAVLASAPRPDRAAPGRMARVAIGIGCLVLAVTPALVAQSQTRLDNAVRAFVAGDCRGAIDNALASLEALRSRAEPFEVLGYCDSRLGLDELAVDAMEQAVRRDPRNWEMHYGLALVRGAAGLDPRAAARRALELSPDNLLAQEAVEQFESTRDPRAWERRARRAHLPLK
jgi:O-antigen ligase